MNPSKTNPVVQISHPEKVFWPEEGYTKGDLANFYREVFPWLQPYFRGRILTMERCPDGMKGECFYQKEVPMGMPPGTATKRLPNKGGSRAETFPKPDWVCLDIDPMSESFQDSARASLLVKKFLDELRLVSFPKTSGSRGVHIFIPIKLGPTADEVLAFAEKLVALVAKSHPKELTVEHRIADRGDRVYLDPFRNGAVQTVVTPYSVRRKPQAPVSTPLDWTEVARVKDPAEFNIKTFPKRLKKKDPWADFFSRRQSLQPALKQIDRL